MCGGFQKCMVKKAEIPTHFSCFVYFPNAKLVITASLKAFKNLGRRSRDAQACITNHVRVSSIKHLQELIMFSSQNSDSNSALKQGGPWVANSSKFVI